MFERSIDPTGDMGLGICGIVKKWFADSENNTGNAKFTVKLENSTVFVDVHGNAVLENFNIIKEIEEKGFDGIEWGKVDGKITILPKLTKKECYQRIKDFCDSVLDTCLGKTLQEQINILGLPSLRVGDIENSENYIRSLTDYPTNVQMQDLINQVIGKYGCLEYAYFAIDEYGVEMHQYAKALNKLI